MGEDFGSALERRRKDKGLSREGLARRIGYTYQYVWEQETGRKPPTQPFAEACDHVLAADGALLTLATGREAVKRRTVLGIGALSTMETIRHELTRTVAGDDADAVDVEEWEAIAWEYGHTYLVTPAPKLIDQLSADFLTVKSLLESSGEKSRKSYCRVASQLAVITARTWSSLSEHRQAWRWWRTARVTADASGDIAERMMCRGEEVVMGLYEHRPITVLLDIAEQAIEIGGDHPTRGTVGLWAGIAQAHATLGHEHEAVAALRRLEELTERLPSETTRAKATIYGWPEYRMRHTESYVYAQLGMTRPAYAAQERALGLYPESAPIGRAQVSLHGARCQIIDGDITSGIDQARQALDYLPSERRTDALIKSVVREVVDAVPEAERRRGPVRELAEVSGC
jgi:transcriptional regulator with XRE-family HTH domain